MTYTATSSQEGIDSIVNRTIDFAGYAKEKFSMFLNIFYFFFLIFFFYSSELEYFDADVEPFPTVGVPIVLIYNLPIVSTGTPNHLILDRKAVVDIFLGNIRTFVIFFFSLLFFPILIFFLM